MIWDGPFLKSKVQFLILQSTNCEDHEDTSSVGERGESVAGNQWQKVTDLPSQTICLCIPGLPECSLSYIISTG